MGVFDSFFKKETKDIEKPIDLSPLHNELKKHHERLEKLREYSENLHRYAYYIEHSNTKHKKEIIEQINKMSKWIDYLNENHNNLKQEFNEFKINIRKRLKEDLAYYHEIMEEYLTFKIGEIENKINLFENKKEVNIDIDELRKKIKEDLLKEFAIKTEKVETKENELNKSEKEILRLLFNENKPLTYEQIAEKLNKSVNSVRVYMNNLKIKKPLVDEFLTSNGTKVFSLKNSEMVKTLFNTN